MNRKTFFDAIRDDLFKGSLSQAQTESLTAVLDEWQRQGGGLRQQLAYVLATAFHETGGKFVPIRESMNYSVNGLLTTFGRHRISKADAERLGRRNGHAAEQKAIANILYGGEWGRKNLGNTKPNDGWDYRGAGLAQTTGRGLFDRLGVTPETIMDPKVSAYALAKGIMQGVNTGHKLSEYINAGECDYVNARRTVNADVARNGKLIAGYAWRFDEALEAAGYEQASQKPTSAPKPSPAPSMRQTPVPASSGFADAIAALFRLILSLFPKRT